MTSQFVPLAVERHAPVPFPKPRGRAARRRLATWCDIVHRAENTHWQVYCYRTDGERVHLRIAYRASQGVLGVHFRLTRAGVKLPKYERDEQEHLVLERGSGTINRCEGVGTVEWDRVIPESPEFGSLCHTFHHSKPGDTLRDMVEVAVARARIHAV